MSRRNSAPHLSSYPPTRPTARMMTPVTRLATGARSGAALARVTTMPEFRTLCAADKVPGASAAEWAGALLDILDGRSVLLENRLDGCERRIVRLAGEARQVIYDPAKAVIRDVFVGGHATVYKRTKVRRPRIHFLEANK